MLFLLLLSALQAAAAENAATELDSIRVIGGSQEELSLPLVPKKVSKEKIEAYQYTDVNRALKQTPGIYVREEEGQGLRPNIGLRGTNPDRSKKVVLMEDGILIGPAPYSAPAAYYTPNMNHVESLEVFRGFAAVPFGPNSIGGAINYVSPGIPKSLTAKAAAQFGTFRTRNFKVMGGGSLPGVGAIIQASRLESGGFKVLDGGGPTGFERNDFVLQTGVPLPVSSGRIHDLKFRFGHANEDSHETYLGLSSEDFFTRPYRRYRASALDRMRWKHTKAQVEHELQVSDTALLRTSLYRHDFHRAWLRLDSFRNSGPEGLRNILRNPTGSNLPFYEILTGARDSSSLGTTDAELVLANNDRDYVSQGIQTRLSEGFEWGITQHELELGARYHFDRIQRNHTSLFHRMENSSLLLSGGSQGTKNEDSARALSFSLQDNMSIGRWVVTAVARYENVGFENADALTNVRTKRRDDVFVPGIGLLYQFNDLLSARTSVNQAVTVAGLETSGLEKREEAVNYEAGLKYFNSPWNQAADLTFFYNDYKNLTGTCTASTGCASNQLDQQFSGGQARVMGLEAQVAQGFQIGRVWVPLQFNTTWIQAVWNNTFFSGNGEWGRGWIQTGDPLPYVPRMQYTFTVGMEIFRFKQELAIIYQSRMFDQSLLANREEVPAFGIVDWSASLGVWGGAEIFAKADNLLGREYLVSYRPFGARPGKPRSYMVGVSYRL